ncbi:MaoC family dehydratase N-terminal domain-containing protein [Pseudonocardia sp. S2-4]|uniref:MaoC family dehydratase N-terminal domain-containing protein n=1 Tax=Pseudonocardia humida TaxID=2800819 RepID=A0ABT1A084_9PSEU|nr:MaoC family dehydratase N-terminal domain-containing protein [Pseudonocardia humida]
MDPSVVGRVLPEREVEVERGRLRSFALAIGETDAVYTDLDAARTAGHPDLPVPPTFLFGVGLGRGPEQDFGWIAELGVDLRAVLHGDQAFTYHALAHAGDTLTLAPRIADVFSRKGGALQFLVRETAVRRTDGDPVADLRETLVVRGISS